MPESARHSLFAVSKQTNLSLTGFDLDFHFFSRDISYFDDVFICLLLGGTSSILRTFLGGTSQKTTLYV